MKRSVYVYSIIAILSASSASAFLVSNSSLGRWEELKWLPFGRSRTVGHEEITRQALNEVLGHLKTNGFDLENRSYTDFTHDLIVNGNHNINGYETLNPVIKGNFATDMPEELETFIDVRKRWGHVDGAVWDTEPVAQALHFLRKPIADGILESQQETCFESRRRITLNTVDAIALWLRAGETRTEVEQAEKSNKPESFVKAVRRREHFFRRKSLALLGHSTHTIQDSFSPLHTIREGKDRNYDIRNVCYYDQEMLKKLAARGEAATGCYHPDPTKNAVEMALALKGDSIWIRSADQYRLTKREWGKAATQCNVREFESRGDLERYNYENVFETEKDRQHCLKHEARLAKFATVRYLLGVAYQMENYRNRKLSDQDRKNIADALDRYVFDGTYPIKGHERIMPNGIMRCDGIQPKAPTAPFALEALSMDHAERVATAASILLGRHPRLMVDRPPNKPYPTTLQEYIREAFEGM